MSKVLEPIVSMLEGSNNFTEVWLSNLFINHLVDHWPKDWSLPVDILTFNNIMF